MLWMRKVVHPAGVESPSAIDSAVRDIVERYENLGLELGWTTAAGKETEMRLQEVIDAASAELVLLECKANGIVNATVADRQKQFQQLLQLRAAPKEPPAAQHSTATELPVWRFDWRRSLGCVMLATFAGSLLAAIGVGQGHRFALLGCLTTLMVFGPWQLTRHLAGAAKAALRAVAWVASAVKAAQLNHRLARVERQIIASDLRQGLAERWVEERLGLIRHRIEMQRARAEQAAKIIATRNVDDYEENTCESFVHHTPIQ